MLEKIIWIWKLSISKLDKDKCLFRCTGIPFFSRIISQQGVSLDPTKMQALTDILPLMTKTELPLFLGVLNYLSIFLPIPKFMCEPLHKLTSVKADWTWNKSYQDLYVKVKTIVKKDACMKFYDAARDASGIGHGVRLLQVRDGMNWGHDKIPGNAILQPIVFPTKSLSSVEWCYSNIECKALGILHGLVRFNHYCFLREVCIITDHKPLVAILSKDFTMLSQWS